MTFSDGEKWQTILSYNDWTLFTRIRDSVNGNVVYSFKIIIYIEEKFVRYFPEQELNKCID